MIFEEREHSALAVGSGSNSSPTIEESLISHPPDFIHKVSECAR